MITEILLMGAGTYLLCGFLFAIPFVLTGVGKIDAQAAHGSWGFRVLIIPGTMFLWPWLARRWMKGVHEPPEEINPHRSAARALRRGRRLSRDRDDEVTHSFPVTSPRPSPPLPGPEGEKEAQI